MLKTSVNTFGEHKIDRTYLCNAGIARIAARRRVKRKRWRSMKLSVNSGLSTGGTSLKDFLSKLNEEYDGKWKLGSQGPGSIFGLPSHIAILFLV